MADSSNASTTENSTSSEISSVENNNTDSSVGEIGFQENALFSTPSEGDTPTSEAIRNSTARGEEAAAGAGAAGAAEAAGEDAAEDEVDPYSLLELGDKVVIESTKYGEPVAGIIYYRSGDLLRIKPTGFPNKLIDFARDEETDQFMPEEGVKASYVLKKRDYDTFVEQQNLQKGQLLETIKEDGELGPNLRILALDLGEDSITVKEEGSEDERKIVFDGFGIPRDEAFVILRVKEGPPEIAPLGSTLDVGVAASMAALAEDAVEGEVKEEDEEGADEDEEDDSGFVIRKIGTVALPKIAVYREAKASEKRIPDAIQKIDALNDFMNMLDPREQKNPKALRAVRILVESLFNMKQDITEFYPDGEIKGIKTISPLRLRDLLEMSNVPLGRAVVEIKKRLYTGDEEESIAAEANDDVYFRRETEELAEIGLQPEKRKMAAVSTHVVGESQRNIAFYMEEQKEYDAFGRPWRPVPSQAPAFRPHSDTTVFRSEIPEMDPESASLYGYVSMVGDEAKQASLFKKRSKKAEAEIVERYPVLLKIRYGLERALATTYRKTERGRQQVLVSAEEAPMSGYLLFPQSDAANLGTTRSGSVAMDSARSQAPLQTMEMILEKHEGIVAAPTANDIISLNLASDPATLGNYEVKDYVAELDTPGLGIGDTYASLVEFGLDTVEMSQDVAEVLVQKLERYQEQLKQALNKLREEVSLLAQTPVEPELNNVLPDEAWSELEARIRADSVLRNDLKLFDTTALSYVKSDIAKVAFLQQKHNDLFQAVLGNSPVIMAQERVKAIRRTYREDLEIARILYLNELLKGAAPKPNKCEHVSTLATIRAIPDEGERYFALTKFFTKYQGKRGDDDNWIYCTLCERELLCVHERLQIQAYITPNASERETLQKEINIHFSGGVFQGAYICRHCGQPMRELALDTHLQFDDEGRPMMGRAELVDKDALRQEELDAALGLDQILEAEVEFTNEAEAMYYNVLREIADRAGVPVQKNRYKDLVAMFSELMKPFPSPSSYDRMSRKDPTLPTYSTALARTLVRNAACLILLEVQTAIPDLPVRQTVPKVSPTFLGYPYSEDRSDVRGIQYLAIVISTIKKTNVSPWSDMEFKGTDSKNRITVIQESIERAMVAMVTNSPISALLQDLIHRKRRFVVQKLSGEGIAALAHDQIPSTFLPKQVVLTGAEAAGSEEGAVIPEAVAATGKEDAVVAAWIQQGHAAARKNAPLVLGSPYADITCCKSNITSPGNFWKSLTSLPPLPLRQLGKARQPTIFQTEFNPRPLEFLTAKVPPELTYRLFLKVCFDGPRKGELHEPGLTHQCGWCGFQFPTHPAIMDDREGKAALEEQGVNTSMEAFLELLDETHRKNPAEKYPLPPSPGLEATLQNLLELDPPPTPTWRPMVEALVAAVRESGRENEQGVLTAIGPISSWNEEALLRLKGALVRSSAKRRIDVIDEIKGLSWENFCEVLQAYFLVPYQQIISGFNFEFVFLPSELAKELSNVHVQQIETEILAPSFRIVARFLPLFKKEGMGFALAKLKYFLDQMRAIFALKNKIRPIYFPGRENTFRHLQETLFLGPLDTLFNERVIPETYGTGAGAGAGAGAGGVQVGFPMNLLGDLLNKTFEKYEKERLGYNDAELRVELDVRREREKERILSQLRGMSQEERKMETTMMRLGIGKYAVGGTSAIYKYSKAQFDVEQQELAEAGIAVFSGYSPDDEPVPGGRRADAAGFYDFDMGMTMEQRERDGGYDMTLSGAGDDDN